MASTDLLNIFTIVSNLWFIFPAIGAAMQDEWTTFMVPILIIINSSMYHACNSFSSTCVFDAVIHREYDFFFAQLTIPLITLNVIEFKPGYYGLKRVLLISAAYIISVLQNTVGESSYVQLGIAGVCILLIIVYWIGYALYKQYTTGKMSLPDYNWDLFAVGIGLTGVACSLYSTEMQAPRLYWAIHSCWHADAALGWTFMQLIHKWQDPNAEFAALDRKVGQRASSPSSRVSLLQPLLSVGRNRFRNQK
jgi:hypothetical protein